MGREGAAAASCSWMSKFQHLSSLLCLARNCPAASRVPAVWGAVVRAHEAPTWGCGRSRQGTGSPVLGPEVSVLSLPFFQEFCLFAVVGLVSDFFLQMLFFTTVLSIDIRRMEVGVG